MSNGFGASVIDPLEATKPGAAVVWATQRVDEIRGFADRVTLIDRGVVRFEGTVPELMGTSAARRFLLHIARQPGGVDRQAAGRLAAPAHLLAVRLGVLLGVADGVEQRAVPHHLPQVRPHRRGELEF